VVIGSSREQKLPSLVLEYTIKKNAVIPPRIVHTYDMKFPDAIKPENRAKTGFSFNRFAIPEIVQWKGSAAYLECDQIVFRDVAELFSIPFSGATVLRPKNQASVLVLDCSRLKWNVQAIVNGLDASEFKYQDLMDSLCVEPAENIRCAIPEEWNSLEHYIQGKTALLHYTSMNSQPWRRWWPHPLLVIWMNELKGAVSAGTIKMDVIAEEVSLGSIVPQILMEAEKWQTR
jgi:hypothetical protein